VLMGSADRNRLPVLIPRTYKECLKLKSKMLIKEVFEAKNLDGTEGHMHRAWAGWDFASFPMHN